MDFKQIKCYLCGKDAEQADLHTRLRIQPSSDSADPCECGYYQITHRVRLFRMDKKMETLTCGDKISEERIPLTKEQKEYLIKFVQDNQHDEWEKTALITVQKIDESCKVKS